MRLRPVVLPALAAVIIAVIALAFGSSRPMTPASGKARSTVVSGRTATIRIAGFNYHPDTLTVKVGTEITVTNTDMTAHTLTARSGAFNTGTLNYGKSTTFTVSKPGVYPYYCQYHAFMTGTLRVVK